MRHASMQVISISNIFMPPVVTGRCRIIWWMTTLRNILPGSPVGRLHARIFDERVLVLLDAGQLKVCLTHTDKTCLRHPCHYHRLPIFA